MRHNTKSKNKKKQNIIYETQYYVKEQKKNRISSMRHNTMSKNKKNRLNITVRLGKAF